MAGVLEQIKGSKRKLVRGSISVSTAKVDQKVLELQAAMEILAEVFGTDVSKIDEMLKQRYKEDAEMPQASYPHKRQRQLLLKHRYDEIGGWPLEFCLAE